MRGNLMLDKLEQVEGRGTRAPWSSQESASGGHVESNDDKYLYIADCGLPEQGPDNADLISVARNTLPLFIKFARLVEEEAFMTRPGEPVVKQVTLQDIWQDLMNRLEETLDEEE